MRKRCVAGLLVFLLAFVPVISNITVTPAKAVSLTEAEKAAILAERRDIAEAHMRKMTAMIWRNETDVLYSVSGDDIPENASENFHLVAGRLYQGMPYSFSGGSLGSWEAVITGPDENGVYSAPDLNWQMISGGSTGARFGTDCSGAVCQAWSQIGASVRFQATKNMCPKNGFLRVGEYTSNDNQVEDSACAANGEQVMYRAYAQLQKADAVVHNGHVRMVVSVNVVYEDDGVTINGEQSTITILEQSRQWMREDKHHYDEKLGEEVWEICGVDLPVKFQNLYKYGYQPITCLELIDATAGQVPPAVKDSLSSANYSYENLLSGKLTTTNWVMDTVRMTITDKDGKVVQDGQIIVPRSGTGINRYTFPVSMFASEVPTKMIGFIAPNALTAGAYRCKLVCKLTTGQEFTVRDFAFTVTDARNDIYKTQIDFSQGTVHDCPMCGEKNAQWKPLTAQHVGSGNAPASGHYYLQESMENNASYISIAGSKVCLHLNGKNITSAERAFSVTDSGAELNIMGNGTVTGTKPATATHGAAVHVSAGTLNLYGGTYHHNKNTDTSDTTQRPILGLRDGGIINLYDGAVVEGTTKVKRPNVLIWKGRFNMYGGEVINGYGTNGSNFLVGYQSGYYLSYLCIYGGKITGGTGTGLGGNIYSVYESSVYMYGGEVSGGDCAKGGNLAVKAGGNIRIQGGSVTGGTATTGNGIYATNTATSVTSKTEIDASTGNKKVYSLNLRDCAVIIGPNAMYEGDAYTEKNAFVRVERTGTDSLIGDLPQLTLVSDLELDLNGHSVSDVVTGSYKLTCKDSATDDFTVSDGIYGKVEGADIPAASGYLAVTEAGKTSFHKYEMNMTHLVVNPDLRGLAYKSSFRGDEVVKSQLSRFGIALRLNAQPDAQSMENDIENKTHIALTPDSWVTGNSEDVVKSVYIAGILDTEKTGAVNRENGETLIYGRPYIQLKDGTLLFGNSEAFTFRSAVELADQNYATDSLTDANRTDLANLYRTFRDIMDLWRIPQIKLSA